MRDPGWPISFESPNDPTPDLLLAGLVLEVVVVPFSHCLVSQMQTTSVRWDADVDVEGDEQHTHGDVDGVPANQYLCRGL
jgi:hypothetical protein